MAVLSDTDRAQIAADFMRRAENVQSLTCLKLDVRAAVNGADDALEAELTTLNAGIPQPARGAMTLRQKWRLFQAIINRRAELL